MTNEQLAELIQEGGNDELLPLLWDKTKALIFKICGKIWQNCSKKLEQLGYSFEDLKQEGYNALIFAVGQYKAEKGYKFNTYLSFALKYVVRDLLRGSDALNRASVVSLYQPIGENDKSLLVEDITPDESAAAAFDKVEASMYYEDLYKAIEELPERHREIIKLIYFGEMSRPEIAARFNIPLSTVRYTELDAYKRLKRGKVGVRLRRIYKEN